jgi:signal transduction histidine kinase
VTALRPLDPAPAPFPFERPRRRGARLRSDALAPVTIPPPLLRLVRHPYFLGGVAVAGILATFAAMLGLGDAGRIGAIALVPWVGLLGVELGPLGGALAGAAATALYVAAAEIVGGPSGPFELAVRAGSLVALGLGAGAAGRRLAASERAQRAVAALQTALIDSTLDGICLTDAAGNVLISNAPLRRISVEMGMPPVGTVPERLLSVADRMTEPEQYRARMLELAAHPDVASVDEFEFRTGRIFRGYTAPVSDPDGSFAGRIWTLRDVTADRNLERLRDAFVAAVSHELRTPLTSISGFLELLADEEHELGETGRGYLAVIRRSTDRLQRIVEDLLLVAQIQAHRLELRLGSADLAEIASAAAEAARPAAEEKEIALEVDAEAPITLVADAQRLGQVLDNLVSNAIKFTDRGGSVTVQVTSGDTWAGVSVTDTGVGIPLEEQGGLFSRFFRASTATTRAIPGTGLGLVIARAIVDEHGGRIALRSREGEGTQVTVTLPLRADAPAFDPVRPVAAQPGGR